MGTAVQFSVRAVGLRTSRIAQTELKLGLRRGSMKGGAGAYVASKVSFYAFRGGDRS